MTSGIDQNQDVLTRFINQAASQGASLGSSSSSSRSGSGGSASWFESVARAWGQSMDGQASRIEKLSAEIPAGSDKPSKMIELTSESLRMGFLSQNASTSINSLADGMSAMARKN